MATNSPNGGPRRAAARGILLLMALAAAGCDRAGAVFRTGSPPPPVTPAAASANPLLRSDPLPIQQARAYPELATGAFVTLADFEGAGGAGAAQANRFHLLPADEPNARRYVVHVTRTGIGALEVDLPPDSALALRELPIHDFRPYSLLSLAVFSPNLRDDFQVVLTSHGASWTSGRHLLRPGWNTVLVDLQHLADEKRFDASAVQSLALLLADAARTERIYLDDIMLVENSRLLGPLPEGLRVSKVGLDYRVELPGRRLPAVLSPSADGLFRFGGDQPLLQLVSPGRTPQGGEEDLRLMGPRRISEVEVLENNPIRVRLASTWYFPARGGEWASMNVRRIRWEHTFYGDGRWIVSVEVNNAGGEAIGPARLMLPVEGAWPDSDRPSREKVIAALGAAGRWICLLPPEGEGRQGAIGAYMKPPAIQQTLADTSPSAAGELRDGFDPAQGCYVLRAKAGHCRFTVPAANPPLVNPVFRVMGEWKGEVHVSSDGQAIRTTARLADGSVLFVLPGKVERVTAVEVETGASPLGP